MSKDRGADERLRVMVVDDHALFRRGLEMVLGNEPDLELVGEASDGLEAIEKAQETMPDVVLMDVRMPKRSGIEATAQIKELLPHVKILMLTISDEEADLYDAIMEGAVERVRPKMLTVVAIMAGLLPIMWSTGTGSEIMQRIAVPMIGGMISSTLLTLIVIPAIYALVKGARLERIFHAAINPKGKPSEAATG